MFFAAAIYIHEQAYRFIQTFCKKYFATDFFTLSKTKYLPKISVNAWKSEMYYLYKCCLFLHSTFIF